MVSVLPKSSHSGYWRYYIVLAASESGHHSCATSLQASWLCHSPTIRIHGWMVWEGLALGWVYDAQSPVLLPQCVLILPITTHSDIPRDTGHPTYCVLDDITNFSCSMVSGTSKCHQYTKCSASDTPWPRGFIIRTPQRPYGRMPLHVVSTHIWRRAVVTASCFSSRLQLPYPLPCRPVLTPRISHEMLTIPFPVFWTTSRLRPNAFLMQPLSSMLIFEMFSLSVPKILTLTL